MKKGILLTLCFILLALKISGEEHKTIKVSFNKEQFSFETDAKSAYGNKVNSYKVSKEDPSVSSDISSLANGVYSVSLIIDGKTVDAKSFIKK